MKWGGKLKKLKEWLTTGSNLLDCCMILGLTIIVVTTFFVNIMAGSYLLGVLLIIIPIIIVKFTNIGKGGE